MRFSGEVDWVATIDVQPIIDWILPIDFEEWPQQTRLEDGAIRPAMVTDLSWHDFGEQVSDAVAETLQHYPGCRAANVMLTVVMPRHNIPPHIDQQPPYWVGRIHIPLTTNDESRFIVGESAHHMNVGNSYIVNTEVMHAVENAGSTPRIHLMFDINA